MSRSIIKPLDQRRGWVEGRKIVEPLGGYPTNIEHDRRLNSMILGAKDRLLRRTGMFFPLIREWQAMRDNMLTGYYVAWAAEVLVYPESLGKLERGRDVVATEKDRRGRQWVLPASCVPEEALERQEVGLFIKPVEVEATSDRVVILADGPGTVVPTPFMQSPWGTGVMDRRTGIPLAMKDYAKMEKIGEGRKRELSRASGIGVMPILRGLNKKEIAFGRAGQAGVAYVDRRPAWKALLRIGDARP